jgi:hypothetical protein
MIHNQPDKLIKGVAYHGNRMLRHVETDLRDIVNHHFNLVVHMFSHTDWDRHRSVMKEIIQMTEGHGLDVWVDNWGLGGPPGDKSHFLAYYPDSHQVYNDGSVDPVRACLNSPHFRKFTKEWIDTVYDIGGRSIFWDEPHLPARSFEDGKWKVWSCACSRCKSIYRERYGREMPETFDESIEEFRLWTVVDYFKEVTAYSKAKEMENIVCVMLGASHGISLDSLEAICGMETLDNIGSDPYWLGQTGVHPYDFVFEKTKQNLDICKKFNKKHNIWIQGYATPAGREEEIIWATDAAYDAGARTILVWGFRGSESNDYRAKSPDMAWNAIGEGMRRISDRHNDEIRRRRLEQLNK